MKKILIISMVLIVSMVANAGFLGSKTVAANTEAPNKDYDTVNGSIKVGYKSNVGDLSTVNGSIKVANNSKVGDVSTVNGSITLEQNIVAQSVETVNGSIKIGENCFIENDVETVNGSIIANAGCEIGGGFETVNGKLKAINTKIEGNVEAVNGKIILLDGTSVEDIIFRKNKGFFNNINKKKPIVVLGRNVEINGDIEFEKPVKLYIHDSLDMDDDIENAEIEIFSGDSPY